MQIFRTDSFRETVNPEANTVKSRSTSNVKSSENYTAPSKEILSYWEGQQIRHRDKFQAFNEFPHYGTFKPSNIFIQKGSF